MAVTLKQIEAFVWIADLGSFRAAAERLNTTQPNISARIAALEGALNVSLMERDAGSVRLTARGRDLLDHARAVLRQVDGLIEASGEAGLYDGTIRLGVTELIANTWLRDFLRAFNEAYPKISVELTVDMSANLEEELFSHRIDLALQNGPFSRIATGHMEIGRYPLIWCASPRLKLQDRGNLTAADLAAHPILTHARGARQHSEIALHFSEAGEPVRLVPSSTLSAGIQMAVNAMGVVAVPAALVLRELNAGELVELDYAWHPGTLDFAARYDARTAPSYLARAAEIARETALGHDWPALP